MTCGLYKPQYPLAFLLAHEACCFFFREQSLLYKYVISVLRVQRQIFLFTRLICKEGFQFVSRKSEMRFAPC